MKRKAIETVSGSDLQSSACNYLLVHLSGFGRHSGHQQNQTTGVSKKPDLQ